MAKGELVTYLPSDGLLFRDHPLAAESNRHTGMYMCSDLAPSAAHSGHLLI